MQVGTTYDRRTADTGEQRSVFAGGSQTVFPKRKWMYIFNIQTAPCQKRILNIERHNLNTDIFFVFQAGTPQKSEWL